MQLIAALILCVILLAIVGAAIYFARHQNPNTQQSSSPLHDLGTTFGGAAMDTRENLEETISNGQQQARTRHKIRSRKHK
jgi:hypothetical protein